METFLINSVFNERQKLYENGKSAVILTVMYIKLCAFMSV